MLSKNHIIHSFNCTFMAWKIEEQYRIHGLIEPKIPYLDREKGGGSELVAGTPLLGYLDVCFVRVMHVIYFSRRVSPKTRSS